jgi:hypothetical protein
MVARFTTTRFRSRVPGRLNFIHTHTIFHLLETLSLSLAQRPQAFLDWEIFSSDGSRETETMRSILNFFDDQADLLIAADVIYDITLVPLLAKLVKRFLSQRGGRRAIFATTLRNMVTFQSFEDQLKLHNVNCKYEPRSVIDELPRFFPIYFLQPRSDIRICDMILDDCWDT